jgi:hypothetical protein
MQFSQVPTYSKRAWRGRALIAARIIFNNGSTTLDCVIRNLSEDGAKLHLSGGATAPSEFSLFLIEKNITRKARVVWRRGEEIGVEFLRPPSAGRTEMGEAVLLQRIQALEAENERLKARVQQLTEG